MVVPAGNKNDDGSGHYQTHNESGLVGIDIDQATAPMIAVKLLAMAKGVTHDQLIKCLSLETVCRPESICAPIMIGATSDGANINERTGTENSDVPNPLNPRRTPEREIATRAATIHPGC